MNLFSSLTNLNNLTAGSSVSDQNANHPTSTATNGRATVSTTNNTLSYRYLPTYQCSESGSLTDSRWYLGT